MSMYRFSGDFLFAEYPDNIFIISSCVRSVLQTKYFDTNNYILSLSWRHPLILDRVCQIGCRPTD